MSLVTRLPVAVFGAILVVSALQASCGGQPDGDATGTLFETRDVADASPGDGASDDSPDDRADGMSYGDGYGK